MAGLLRCCPNREAGAEAEGLPLALLSAPLGPDLMDTVPRRSSLHSAMPASPSSSPTLCRAPLSALPSFFLQYRVVVPLMGAVSDLCEALSRLSGVAAENVRRSGQWHSAYWGHFIVLGSVFSNL